jgi:hypothetical protein
MLNFTRAIKPNTDHATGCGQHIIQSTSISFDLLAYKIYFYFYPSLVLHRRFGFATIDYPEAFLLDGDLHLRREKLSNTL